MSVITVQFGQCGNQIGHNLLQAVAKDIGDGSMSALKETGVAEESVDRWFRRREAQDSVVARTVLVDTEQKVVEKICKKQLNETWAYDKANVVTHIGGGSANNWAFGYGKRGVDLNENVMEALRKEVECCDRVSSFLTMLSSAGGTGSGVGSYIGEAMRDEYPTKTMISAVVLPYQTGEVATQNYNTILSLSKLYNVSDMIIIFENEQLHKMSTTLLKESNVDFSHLNRIISMKIASVFQPAKDPSQIQDIVSHMTAHPAYKLVSIKTCPHSAESSAVFETSYKWDTLLRHIKQTIRVSATGKDVDFNVEARNPKNTVHLNSLMQYACCISNVLVTRGPKTDGFDPLELMDNNLYPTWIPSNSRLIHFHNDKRFLGGDKFVTLVTNNGLIYSSIDEIVQRGWATFQHKAYLHQYAKYGVEEIDLISAFAKMETVIKDYQELR